MSWKYTPGPWRHARQTKTHGDGTSQTFGADSVFSEDESRTICSVYGIYSNTRLEECLLSETCAEGIANARLIAAAPELLEALKEALAYNDASRLSPGVGEFSWAKKCRAAIAKAEGATE